jgi:hypothetical protein
MTEMVTFFAGAQGKGGDCLDRDEMQRSTETEDLGRLLRQQTMISDLLPGHPDRTGSTGRYKYSWMNHATLVPVECRRLGGGTNGKRSCRPCNSLFCTGTRLCLTRSTGRCRDIDVDRKVAGHRLYCAGGHITAALSDALAD